jgi:hypothetical protein
VLRLISPFPRRKLPEPQVFRPLIHIVALAADVRRPTIVVAADLLHEKCDAPFSAFVSRGPGPCWLQAACTAARLAPADDPVRNASAPLKPQPGQRAEPWLVRDEFDAGADACPRQDCPPPLVVHLILARHTQPDIGRNAVEWPRRKLLVVLRALREQQPVELGRVVDSTVLDRTAIAAALGYRASRRARRRTPVPALLIVLPPWPIDMAASDVRLRSPYGLGG